MRMIPRSLFLLILGLATTACLNLGTPPPASPVPPGESPAPPSPTVVWFPPSATPTPLLISTPTATPEMRPNLGAILLQDEFRDPSLWNTASSAQGSVSMDSSALTIAAQPGAYLYTLRSEPSLDNFYAEVTARLSLCRDGGEYGLLIRASSTSYYRLSLICNGALRIDRINNGTRYPLQPLTLSSDVPRGAPAQVRIGLWASGAEMRFFINDNYQFTITDKTFLRGTIGLFARATADLPVTVTFSNLTIRSLRDQVSLTPTVSTDLFTPFCAKIVPLPSLPIESTGPYRGWSRYTHPTYGFSLAFPPDWQLGEGQNFICLKPPSTSTIFLVIGFKRNNETVTIQRTGVGAGDIATEGTVNFLNQNISRDVLTYQGKVKAILYNMATEIPVNSLVFTFSLDDFTPDYESISLPAEIQKIADQIVESFNIEP